ncbi:MAG: hypothetical protein OEW42_19040 [Acidimicrobiia bacterium]|nr:hypothetical protein [Acidimicrobiia bacterium]
MSDYVERQVYPVTVLVLVGLIFVGLFAVLLAIEAATAAAALLAWSGVAFTFAAFLAFSRLTTTVTPDTVTAAFRFGRPRRVIPVTAVLAVRVRRNSWWLGWGLRKVPKGWMYNLWGVGAVELQLDSGAVFRTGSAHPEELEAAIGAELLGPMR